MPWSFKRTTHNDNTRLDSYGSASNAERHSTTTMPWQVVSSHRAPSMKPLRAEDSWGETYRATRNNSLGTFDTDRLTGLQDPIATPRKPYLERLSKRNERWASQNARHDTYELTKKGSVANAQIGFLNQGTMKAPAHYSQSVNNLYGYLPLDHRQEEHRSKHKSKGENRLFMLPDAKNLTTPYFLHILNRVNDSLTLQPSINRDSNKSIIISNVKSSANKRSKPQSARRQSHDGLDFILYHENLASTFTDPETKGRKNEASLMKPSNNYFRIAENTKENISTQPATFVSSPFDMHSTDLGTSLPVGDTLPSYDTDIDVTQLFSSTTDFNLESQKQSKIDNGKHKATLVPDGDALKILPLIISPTKTYVRETDKIQALEDLNRSQVSVVTISGSLNNVNSAILLSSILDVVHGEVVKASLPHDLRMSESFLYSDIMQKSETLSRPQEDLPSGLLRSVGTFHFNLGTKSPETMSLTPSPEVTQNRLMTPKSSVFNVGDLRALLSSTSSHTSLKENEPLISFLYYSTAENQPTLQLLSTEITGHTKSLTESEEILPNGFLESEPFYFVINKKSVPENNGNLDLKTPMLFSASLSSETFKSTRLISLRFDSAHNRKYFLSTPSVDQVSSAASSSVISRAVPSATHALFQPTSVWKSSTAVSSGANSSEGEGYSENKNEGVERDTFWPVVAALVVGIPSVIVFGIAITVFHRRRWVS